MDKRSRLVDDDELEVDEELVEAIGRLQEVQDDLEKVNEEASDKILEVEEQYNLVRRPYYDRRNEVIKSIPDFWLTAFQSHPLMMDYLTEDDQKVFKYLHTLDCEDFKDIRTGFKITLTFKQPNPYLVQEQLVKEYRFSREGIVTLHSTKPQWKPGMEPSTGSSERAENGNSKRKREEKESFFKWFHDAGESEKNSWDMDDDIADILKDDLWPNPLRYFTQEMEDEEEEWESDGDGGTDEDEDDDETEENGGRDYGEVETEDDEDGDDDGE